MKITPTTRTKIKKMHFNNNSADIIVRRLKSMLPKVPLTAKIDLVKQVILEDKFSA